MDNFVTFLITLALHVPLVMLEKDRGKLDPPQVIISYDVDPYSPVAILASKTKDVIYDVEYMTPYGKQVFKTSQTSRDFDPVYGAPCYVRVRAKTGHLVSDWSRMAFVVSKY